MGSKFLPGEFVMVKGDVNSGTSDVVFQIKQVFQKFVSYYKKQVQAVSQDVREVALKLHGKRAWDNMTWKKRYEVVANINIVNQKKKSFSLAPATVGLATATDTPKTLCQAGTTVYTLQKDVKLSSQSTNASNLPTGTKKKEAPERQKKVQRNYTHGSDESKRGRN